MRIIHAKAIMFFTISVIIMTACKTPKPIVSPPSAASVLSKQLDVQADEIKQKIQDVAVERTPEGIVVEINSRLMFDFDKSEIAPVAKKILDDLVTILHKYPDTNIEIQGHTDSIGTDQYNLVLSRKRAFSVFNYIKGKDIDNARIKKVQGYGKEGPKYPNDTEENRALNRRVDFQITPNEKMKANAAKLAAQP